MGKFLRSALVAGVLAAGAVAAYRYLLDDEARGQLTSLGKTTAKFASTMNDTYGQAPLPKTDSPEAARNRQWVKSQWESLGY